MRYQVKADCSAYLTETWHVEIPDDTPEDEVEDAINAKLCEGEAEFIDQRADGEHDRTVIGWEEIQ